MLLNLVNNIAFLVALVAAAQLVIARFREDFFKKRLLLGLLFGAVAVLGMATPVVFEPGIIFDGRTIVLAVAGVVGGVLPAAIAAAYRYSSGGAGVTVGVLLPSRRR